MNKSSFFGFAIFGFVIFGVFNYVKAPEIFFDSRAIIFVLGCTVAAAFVAYPYGSLSRTVDYLLWGMLFKKKREYLKVSQEIAAARNSFFSSQTYMASEDSHPFFREATLFLMNPNIGNEALDEILRNRSDYFRKRYEDDAGILKSLAKYPVAFGFLSAIISLLAVLPNVQSHPNDILVILLHGAGAALISVFWGIALANFLLLPVADSAARAANEDTMLRSLIIDGMLLIRNRATDDHFQAYLRGYLSLADRSEFKVFAKNVLPFTVGPVQRKVVAAVEAEEPAPAPVVEAAPVQAADEEATVFPVPPPTSQVESSSASPTNLAEFDFKDLKVKPRELKKKFR